MKKFLLILLVPLVVSAAAIAAPNPASVDAHCKNLLRQGPAYPSLEACVTAKTLQAAQNTTNAAKTCKAAQTADAAAFAATYAPGANGKSNGKAMGACVSTTANASAVAQQTTEVKAAKLCKSERNAAGFAAAHNNLTFAQVYGKNTSLKNAFGKCVSMHAKAPQS